MKQLVLLGVASVVVGCASTGGNAYPNKSFLEQRLVKSGVASYYSDALHGRLTASGEPYNKYELTAAHKKLKFGTWVLVTNPNNNKSVVVKINDRGPFIKGRVIDLSRQAAEEIDMIQSGVLDVELQIVSPP